VWKVTRLVVSVLVLTWYIRYWNSQFLNNVIIIKSKVLLPQVKLTIVDLQLLNSVIIIKSKVFLPQVKLTIADLQLLNNVINGQLYLREENFTFDNNYII
jgi:hypothetical protein